MKMVVNIEHSDLMNALQDDHDELLERIRELESENDHLKCEITKKSDLSLHLLKVNAQLNDKILNQSHEDNGDTDDDFCGSCPEVCDHEMRERCLEHNGDD